MALARVHHAGMNLVIGTAGWTIPATVRDRFPGEGSALERYASVLGGAEINSSFHRSHRLSTWERWRESVPDGFRFSVKLPKTVTHKNKLRDCGELLDGFFDEARVLGSKLAVVLVQLPPSLAYDESLASEFFAMVQDRTDVPVACEPRHASWFDDPAEEVMRRWSVARVAADPAVTPTAATPGGHPGLHYYRLHGSPQIYRSSYSQTALSELADKLSPPSDAEDSWCVFDNTASSAAMSNALMLRDMVRSKDAR